jgi:hypothetical protein
MSGDARVNARRMVMLRQPPQRVWLALRDDLPAISRYIDGIDEIRLIERGVGADGLVRTIHEWRAAASLAAALRGKINDGALTWLERATWHPDVLESRWSVESRILGGGLVGSGTTRIEPAMGGRGSRLQLEVSTAISSGSLGPFGEGRWKSGIEDAAATLLAKTLQELGKGVETFLVRAGELPGSNGAGH